MSKYRFILGRKSYVLDTYGIEIGDYVTVKNNGRYYLSFGTLFRYFWGNEHTVLDLENGGIWKVINMASHTGILVVHIRNRKGDNVAICIDGLKKIDFHKRNRAPISERVLATITSYSDTSEIGLHTYKDKLYKIIK